MDHAPVLAITGLQHSDLVQVTKAAVEKDRTHPLLKAGR
jgi:hypothetical protein